MYAIRQSSIEGIVRCRCRVEFFGDVPSVESEGAHVSNGSDGCPFANFLETQFFLGNRFCYCYYTPARERFVVRIN